MNKCEIEGSLGGRASGPFSFPSIIFEYLPDLSMYAMIAVESMPDIKQDELIKAIAEGLSFPESDDFDKAVEKLREFSPARICDTFKSFLDDPDAGLALGVARAVGMLNCCEAADLMLGLVHEPGKWFSHAERAAILFEAVQTLGIIRISEAVDPLLEMLRFSHDPELQMAVVRAIGNIGSPDSIDSLIDEMETNPPIALSAAGAIVQIGGDKAFHGLVRLLSIDNDMIRSASVWALGTLHDERAIPHLLELIRHSDSFLRRDIAWALGQIGGLKARITLGALSQADTDPGVRHEAARAIKSGAVLGKYRNDPRKDSAE